MKIRISLLMSLVSIILLSGCLSVVPSQTETFALDVTNLYRTSEAEVTAAYGKTATIQVYESTGIAAALTAAVTPTQIPTLPRTRTPEYTSTSSARCNAAAPGYPLDVTIRDDEEMSPGMSFTKTWRLENVGSCKWSTLYKLVFFSGNPLDSQQEQYLSGEVLPGNSIDLSVDMVSPDKAGLYQSNWMLADSEGNLFGLGPNGDAPFWVRIQVVQEETPTVTPTVTLMPTPIIYREGSVSLINEDYLDLDTGLTNPEENFADFLYELRSPNHFLIPSDDAGLMIFGKTVPSFQDCVDALVDSEALSFDAIDPEVYICYQTNKGLPGRLRLISFDDDGDILKLDFLTWSIP